MISLSEQMQQISWAKIYAALIGKKEQVIDFSLLALIIAFIFSYFEPRYLFLKTTTSGGDTASHYYTAQYLRDYLIPHGKITGWIPGNYAGYPLFQIYFPLPFILMAFLSYLIPLQISFKLVSVLGTFLLPICTFFSLRFLGYRFPTPILGAVLTLPFLFMEANSMWGGNIPSTLAGEFSLSLSLSLTILFLGTLYHGIVSGKWTTRNAILVFLIGLSHAFTLIFAGFTSLFFLFTTKDFIKRFAYLAKVYLLGFCLLGFWIVPLLMRTPYTTRFNPTWDISSVFEWLPPILIPFVVLAILGTLLDLFTQIFSKKGKALDLRIYYLWFGILISAIFYLVAIRTHLVPEVRFIPFVQLLLMIICAVGVAKLTGKLQVQWLVPIIAAIAILLWVESRVVFIKDWVAWNYTGSEGKNTWNTFSEINRFLSGSVGDPRVVYENSSANNAFGTVRAFESLPLFSGRSTLEGLYMQSSITTPFVFYLQSEVSIDISCPLPDYKCARLDLKKGIKHFEMFNVKDFIVRSDVVKAEIKKYPEFRLEKVFGAYEIYELTTNENRYVTPLKYEPVLFVTENFNKWNEIAYRWFRNIDFSDVPLVFSQKPDESDLKRFKTVRRGDIDHLPKIPITAPCQVKEQIDNEEIRIKTTCINRPVLIKISYHPNWKVRGADKIYRVSPSFMLVYPQQNEVTLYYGSTLPNYVGLSLTWLGFIIMMTPFLPVKGILSKWLAIFKYKGPQLPESLRLKVLVTVSGVLVTSLIVFLFFTPQNDPAILHEKGMAYFNKGQYDKAQAIFSKILERYPQAPMADSTNYSYAISYFKEKNYQKTLEEFERLVRLYPDSMLVPEAYYHIGLSQGYLNQSDQAKATYHLVMKRFPESNWAKYAKERLDEMTGPGFIFKEAMADFDRQNWVEARKGFSKILKDYPNAKEADTAAYFFAICSFKQGDYARTIGEFQQLIKNYPRSPAVPEAYYHIALSYGLSNNVEEARKGYQFVVKTFPTSIWSKHAQDRLGELKGH
jgi:TolA-binding protein